jgi:hypothetical protein
MAWQTRAATCAGSTRRPAGAWITAEKILEADEQMPADWPSQAPPATTPPGGSARCTGDPNGYGELATIAHTITGDIPAPWMK